MTRGYDSINILLVEDNEADILLLEEVFREAKIKNDFTVVKDGKQALKLLERDDPYGETVLPDVIFLDLNIPYIKGHEILLELKKREEWAYIPVVVLTTSNSIEDVKKAYRNHANCFITKPMNLDDFVEVVKSIEHFWFNIVRLPR